MKSVLKKAVVNVNLETIEGLTADGLAALNGDLSTYVDRCTVERVSNLWSEGDLKKEEDRLLFEHFFSVFTDEKGKEKARRTVNLDGKPDLTKDIFLSVFAVAFGYAKVEEKLIPASFDPIYGEAVKALNASPDGIIPLTALKPIREKANALMVEMFRHTTYNHRPLADGKMAGEGEYIPHFNNKYVGYFVSRAHNLKLGKRTLTAKYEVTKKRAFYKVFCQVVVASLTKVNDMTVSEETKAFKF